jgi:hypothetical protein
MELAVAQRRRQGRGPLDHWDMFANVMATRNAMPSANPHHLSLTQVTARTAREVNRATGLRMPDVVEVQPMEHHAETGGGWYERGGRMSYKPQTTLAMGRDYASRALARIQTHEDTDYFRKFVRTVSHEMTHGAQRQDQGYMSGSTTANREMQAYGSEVLAHPRLPALHDPELSLTRRKFDTEFRSARSAGRVTVEETRQRAAIGAQAATGKGVGM